MRADALSELDEERLPLLGALALVSPSVGRLVSSTAKFNEIDACAFELDCQSAGIILIKAT